MYNFIVIAYLINLKRAEDRLSSAKETFNKVGIKFELEVAVDGKELSLPNPNYAELKYNLLHGKKTNLGELGCYFSHLNVLKKFLDTKEDFALVCEDDIEFEEDIVEIINSAITSGVDFDLLRLSGGSDKTKEKGMPIKLKKIYKEFYIALNFGFKSGTGCYLINRLAAKNILERMSIMRLPIDHAMDRDWVLNLRSLCIKPSPVHLKEELHLGNSYIQAKSEFKFPFYKRYWIMAPYRILNELTRLVYKLFIFIKIKIES
jgi:glycosyl transferase family 25